MVEISGDAGQSWQTLSETFRGVSTQWQRKAYELTNHRGPGFDDVRIRFRVQTDSVANAPLPGWFIDDIRVVQYAAVAVAETDAATILPNAFVLHQNFPNPFAQTATHFRYDLPLNAEVELAVFDLMGNRIATLARGRFHAGRHRATWNGEDERGRIVASGIYFCSMRAATETGRVFQQVRRVLWLR